MSFYVFANNVNTQLAAPAASTDVTLQLASASNLPTLPSGQIMPLTLTDTATGTIVEIVYVTAISGSTLTVIRGREGTGATAWPTGSYAFSTPTKATNVNYRQTVSNIAGLRLITPISGNIVETLGGSSLGDGNGLDYYGASGASIGTYVDNGSTIIVPTGGNGSAAWLMGTPPSSEYMGYTQGSTGSVSRTVASKLQESVSVLDFGADPTGVADSTAAFSAAGSSDGTGVVEVEVPIGTYKLNANPTPTGIVTWVVRSGATFTGVGSLNGIGKTIRFSGPQAPLFIENNSVNTTGQALGLYLHIGNNPTATPVAGDSVAQTITINNLNGRTHLWGMDVVVAPDASGSDGMCRVLELEIANTVGGSNPDPFSGNTPYRKNGIEVVGMDGSNFNLTSSLTTWANDTTGNKWWLEGISLSRIKNYGIHFYKNPGGVIDSILPFQVAAIYDNSDSATVLKVDGTHTNIIDLSNLTTLTSFVKMGQSSNQTLPFSNEAAFDITIKLDAGTGAGIQNASLTFADRGTTQWGITKTTGNSLAIANSTSGVTTALFNYNSLSIGGANALGAVTGHFSIPTCAGTPTGVPAYTAAGTVAVQFDTTNNFLYVYNNGWKKSTVYA